MAWPFEVYQTSPGGSTRLVGKALTLRGAAKIAGDDPAREVWDVNAGEFVEESGAPRYRSLKEAGAMGAEPEMEFK